MYKKDKYNGFTLIELLLYITITGTVLLSISVFLFLVLQTHIKNQIIGEVEQQGTQVMEAITRIGRNAEGINSPAQGTSSSALSLDVLNSAKDPTVFDLSDNTIRITENSLPSIALTSSRIIASDITFQNLTKNNTPGNIRVRFTITHVNPGGKNEYNYSKTFYGSISLRY